MAGAGGKIKVLIVDDSALVRQLLTQILGADASIEVVGAAQDAKRIAARNRNVDLLRMLFSVYNDFTRLARNILI